MYMKHNSAVHLCNVHTTSAILGYPNSQIPFQSNRALLWFNITSNDITYLDLHVKHPIFLPNCTQICIFSADVHISSWLQISHNSIQWEPQWYIRTDWRLDMTEPIDTFRKYRTCLQNSSTGLVWLLAYENLTGLQMKIITQCSNPFEKLADIFPTNSPTFMEHKVHYCAPRTCHWICPEPYESSTHPHSLLP